MATRTRWLLLILALLLIPVVGIPVVFVGMRTNPELVERVGDGFGLLAALLALGAAVLFLVPLRVPRLRRWAYGPELAEHFNHPERKPLMVRYAVSFALAWLFMSAGNLIRSLDSLDDTSDWNIWGIVGLVFLIVGVVLMFSTFHHKRALDRLSEESGDVT